MATVSLEAVFLNHRFPANGSTGMSRFTDGPGLMVNVSPREPGSRMAKGPPGSA